MDGLSLMHIFLTLSLIVAILLYSSAALPRGLRNNNPGNIVYDGTRWIGINEVTPSDGKFVKFNRMAFGVRAMAILLGNYQTIHGIDTIAGIIDRYSGDSDEIRGAYKRFVAEEMKMAPNRRFNVKEKIRPLISAMILFENGGQMVNRDDLETGLKLAAPNFSM